MRRPAILPTPRGDLPLEWIPPGDPSVHPHFDTMTPDYIPAGWLTSRAFVPFEADAGKRSVDDGDQITDEAFRLHIAETLGLQSRGAWSVSRAEATGAGPGSVPDPPKKFPSRAPIGFAGQPAGHHGRLAKQLKACAVTRGCLYQPLAGSADSRIA